MIMYFSRYQHLKFHSKPIIVSIIAILLLIEFLSPSPKFQWLATAPASKSQNTIRKDKFVQISPISFGGLNNQKISFARAVLTSRFLNRTLLFPTFNRILSNREVELKDAITFDKIFDFDKFNSLCDGFVRLGLLSSLSNKTKPFEMKKRNDKSWPMEKDLHQLRWYKNDKKIDEFEVIRITGIQPYLWYDYWPVKDYANVFECMVLTSEIEKEVSKVTSKIKEVGLRTRNNSLSDSRYIVVHMRRERDWKDHCKKGQKWNRLTNVCSNEKDIVEMVSYIARKIQPALIYLAVADSLSDDDSVLSGWGPGLVPYDKKSLGVWDIYEKQPYIIQSAIDFEVSARAEVFVGNTFSTFSALVVLSRTTKLLKLGITNVCNGPDVRFVSYAHNVLRDKNGGPKRWMTDMSDSSFVHITFGSVDVSCDSKSLMNI